VLAATNNQQVPWENHALLAKFYFGPAHLPPPKAQTAEQQQLLSEAASAWIDIKASKDVAVFEAFRRQYGPSNALYDTLAAQRIAQLAQADHTPATAKSNAQTKMPKSNCIVLGRTIPSAIDIEIGTKFCPQTGRDSAVINNITEDTVIFSVNGGYQVRCRPGDLCQFGWAGAPVFKVSIQKETTAVSPAGAILPDN